ncbi:YbjN domain-containing protein [Sphingopyxis witflariensis]|uniref:YbjN domain-containing protein n=1 Tax=Sphingopyxis witflariensis TaxID=173675 RepID=A0A246K4M6_9SPHN|nr:YbjN domain-containing protein [Sphingopyxis witflariensis]OWR00927.1 YbjN domain-containing protein [Sphingopyxis witflariensis]
MKSIIARTALTLGASVLFAAAPAHAELVNAKNPAAIKTIVESQGWPAKLITKAGEDPYIESNRNGLKFLVLFMNCEENKNCKTLQYYMGFSDAKEVTIERLNQWNKDKRFARAYRDDAGDPVLEMDVDLDFAGIPRENVGETFNTWASLMDSYREYVFEKDE